jgi:predicted O-linked N-acetylglucosamine transferase (SPINDLY family)
MDTIESLIEQAIAALKSKDWTKAQELLEQAMQATPKHPLVHYLMAQMHIGKEQFPEAIAMLEKTVTLQPDFLQGWVDLGKLYMGSGDKQKAAQCHEHRFRLAPTPALALETARLYQSLGKHAKTLHYYQQATSLAPDSFDAWYQQGTFLNKQNMVSDAIICFKHALKLTPRQPDTLKQLAAANMSLGAQADANAYYDELISVEPVFENHIEALLCSAVVADTMESLKHQHQTIKESLTTLLAPTQMLTTKRSPINIKGLFHLSYNGFDNRNIKVQLTKLIRRYLPELNYVSSALPGPLVDGRKIRVGFVSTYFYHHTIGKLFLQLIAALDRRRFSVYVFAITPERGAMTEAIQAAADQYWEVGTDYIKARELIAAQSLDVLNFTDIGMHNFTYLLSFARLARVQCVYWGHPETTGIDTLDYYISSDLIEASGAEAHYSEKLVRLKHLPVIYDPIPIPPPSTNPAITALRDIKNLYVCPQSLFKLRPDYDEILADILHTDPQGVLVLIEGYHSQWTDALKQRFTHTIADVMERIIFLPRLTEPDFLALLMRADVMLDSFHFGGGNSTFEALALGCPIVTWPGEFMRGRVTYGCYQQMGILELVAKDAKEYVQIAVKVATDKAYQRQLRQRIRERAANTFNTHDIVLELGTFFTSVCNN